MNDADPSLSVPELPSPSRELGSPAFPLHRTPPLDEGAPFTLTGARVSIAGGCDRGVNDVRAGETPILGRLRVEGAIAAAATLTPLGLERELRIEGVGVVERVAVAQADPVCFFEWRIDPDRPLVVRWLVPGVGTEGAQGTEGDAGGRPRWRAVERGLVVETPAGRTLFAFSRAPAEMSVEGAAGADLRALDVRAGWDPEVAGGSVRLAVGFVPPGGDEARVLRVMRRSHVVVPAGRAVALRVLEDRLSLSAPDTALADALAWAVIRLAGSRPGHRQLRLDARELRLALAALATGDRAAARARLAPPDTPDEIPAETPDEAARHLLLASRYLAWTGDLRTVGASWETTRSRALARVGALAGGDSSGESSGDSSAESGDPELLLRALRALVVAAEEVGDGEVARRVRGAVAALPESESGRPEEEGLPAADALEDDAQDTDDLLAAAAMVEAVVEGLLGVQPDAPRGRLVLRPRLPRSWDACVVRNLRVGEGVVELELAREVDRERGAARHVFTLRQVSGGAPLRVIFEPELVGDGLVGAWVDGEPAELDVVAVEGRVRVPVQVVLDHERRVEVEIEGADA